jgi:hypothetical protein
MADPLQNNLDNEKQRTEDLLDISNRLVASLRTRRDLGAEITENERLQFSIGNQMKFLALDILSAMEKRKNYSIKAKELAKDIEKIEKNRNKNEELASRTIQQLNESQIKYALEISNIAKNLRNQKKFNSGIST